MSEQHRQARLYRYRKDARRVRHPRYIGGQQCLNCDRFRTLDAWCSLFPEYSVSPSGWCDQWQLKSGTHLHSPSAISPASDSGGYIPLNSIRQNNE
nr:high-potential iron-sulfur protein [Oceanospirillum sediminis]